MAITRACSYTATIGLPEDPANYEAILVTFRQREQNVVEKTEAELTFDGNKVVVQLDQAETKQFQCGYKTFLQIRCYKSQYEAPGSAIWSIEVRPALNDSILPLSNEPEGET